jgi:hypothetical protein
MDDELKKLMQVASRDVAGGLFQQRPVPETILPMKGVVDYLEEMFSSAHAINALAFDLDRFKANTPENHQIKVTMLTIEGEILRVRKISPVGFQMFTARGFVNGQERQISGHISRLELSLSYEDLGDKDAVDFTIEVPEVSH